MVPFTWVKVGAAGNTGNAAGKPSGCAVRQLAKLTCSLTGSPWPFEFVDCLWFRRIPPPVAGGIERSPCACVIQPILAIVVETAVVDRQVG